MKLIYIENNKYLNILDGNIYTEEELDFIMEMEILHEKEFRQTPSIYKLMEMFPSAKQAAKRGILNKIRLYKQEIENINNYRENFINTILPKMDMMEFSNRKFYIETFTEAKIEEIKDEIEKLKKEKRYVDSLGEKKTKDTEKITQEIIERVKTIPISNFIDIKKDNKTICLFHNEKTPSMHVYRDTNTFHCFSCGSHGTVIDIIMQLKSVDFIEAVKYLKQI